jgi:hypothetical protein
MLKFFKHNNASPFCQHKTISVTIKRPAGLLRARHFERQGSHILKPC